MVFECLIRLAQPVSCEECGGPVYPERISMQMITTIVDYQRRTAKARASRLSGQQLSDLVSDFERGR